MKEKAKFNQKILIIILSVVLALVAVGGLTTIFLLNYNGFTPAAPSVLDDGNNIYIMTPLNDKYESYRFKFHSKSQDIIIDTETNVVSADQVVTQGGKIGEVFEISVALISEKEGNNSVFGKTTKWTCCQYLSAPEISYSKKEEKIQWYPIRNADFYRVFIDNSSEYIDVTDTMFSLKGLMGGRMIFSVVACSNNAGYKTSTLSKSLDVEYVRVFKGFTDLNFNLQSKVFTCFSEEEYAAVNIALGGSLRSLSSFQVDKVEDKYKYTIDMSAYYNDETLIGIIPKNIDKYNVNNSQISYYRIENA